MSKQLLLLQIVQKVSYIIYMISTMLLTLNQ